MELELRRTGRTQRMLMAALESVRDGGYAFVMCNDKQQSDNVLRRLATMTPGRIASTKFYPASGGQLSVETPESVRFDWDHLHVTGAHSSCRVFVDHYAIEQRFGRLFRIMHEWDLPAVPPAGEE